MRINVTELVRGTVGEGRPKSRGGTLVKPALRDPQLRPVPGYLTPPLGASEEEYSQFGAPHLQRRSSLAVSLMRAFAPLAIRQQLEAHGDTTRNGQQQSSTESNKKRHRTCSIKNAPGAPPLQSPAREKPVSPRDRFAAYRKQIPGALLIYIDASHQEPSLGFRWSMGMVPRGFLRQ